MSENKCVNIACSILDFSCTGLSHKNILNNQYFSFILASFFIYISHFGYHLSIVSCPLVLLKDTSALIKDDAC